jgi:Gpi18-like mannosyltransferase
MIRLTTPFFGNSFLAALVISHAATLYALKLLLDLFSQWSNPQTGRKTLFYFLLYPTAFYLFSAYTEPIFLVVALLAFRNMKANDWGWAGFWTFCAISTRLQGAALIPAMLFLMWRDKPFLQKVSHWAGLGFSGIALFFYLFLRSTQVDTGPVPFSEPAWNARLVPPWQTYIYAVQSLLSGDFNYIDLINWFVATLFVVLLILGWREMPMEYNLYTTFSILTIFIRIVDGQPLISMSRYALTLFPLFFILAKVDSHPIGRRIVIYTSIALSLYLSQEFFSWGWVA